MNIISNEQIKKSKHTPKGASTLRRVTHPYEEWMNGKANSGQTEASFQKGFFSRFIPSDYAFFSFLKRSILNAIFYALVLLAF